MEFVINIPALYSDRYSTWNVHLLLHLTDRVADLGPLWSTSCFYFEDFNGLLRHLFYGTQSIEKQIAFAVCVHQSLPKIVQTLHYGSFEQEFFKRMMDTKHQLTHERINDKVFVVGAYHSELMSTEEHTVFLVGGDLYTVTFFERLYAH